MQLNEQPKSSGVDSGDLDKIENDAVFATHLDRKP